jgi:hypothetical protein
MDFFLSSSTVGFMLIPNLQGITRVSPTLVVAFWALRPLHRSLVNSLKIPFYAAGVSSKDPSSTLSRILTIFTAAIPDGISLHPALHSRG